MFFSIFTFVVLVLVIVALIFIQIFFGYIAAHPNYDGTKIKIRNQLWIYLIIATPAALILLIVGIGTVGIWGNDIIYHFGLGVGEQDQQRWIVLGAIVSVSTAIMFIAMLIVAKVAECCGRDNIILHPKYTIREKKDNRHL